MRRISMTLVAVLAAFGFGWIAHAQSAQGSAPPPAAAPTDRAAYFDSKDIHAIWQDEEAKQVINKRVAEGGSHSINIRIVLPTNAPLVHSRSADTWVVMEGTATAVTGGQLVDAKQNQNADDMSGSAIEGGTEQALKSGDILFVPPGVPHGFKDIKGFRAYLIRYPTR
jgi:mannose-6-phosphate isomerase-like protein (cupin superfamily)